MSDMYVEVAAFHGGGRLRGFVVSGRWPVSTREWAQFLALAVRLAAVPGLLAKDGYEGVQIAALPDGHAVAVKIADGASRARGPVTARALALAGVDGALLAEFAGERVLGGGRPVGEIRPLLPAAAGRMAS